MYCDTLYIRWRVGVRSKVNFPLGLSWQTATSRCWMAQCQRMSCLKNLPLDSVKVNNEPAKVRYTTTLRYKTRYMFADHEKWNCVVIIITKKTTIKFAWVDYGSCEVIAMIYGPVVHLRTFINTSWYKYFNSTILCHPLINVLASGTTCCNFKYELCSLTGSRGWTTLAFV